MTTIAYRDGVMASDSGCYTGGAEHAWTRKLAAGKDGTLYGVTGGAAECETFLTWVDAGEEAATRPIPRQIGASEDYRSSFAVLIAPAEGDITFLTAQGSERYPGAEYMAVGAGATVAFGALFAGASAEAAITAAAAHSDGARLPVRTIRR